MKHTHAYTPEDAILSGGQHVAPFKPDEAAELSALLHGATGLAKTRVVAHALHRVGSLLPALFF
jgi:hypothetical protein